MASSLMFQNDQPILGLQYVSMMNTIKGKRKEECWSI
jgi:hypothetical protein